MSFLTENWIMLTVLVTSICQVFAEERYCEIIAHNPSYKTFCYDVGTYADCTTTCRNVVIDQLHKDQDCPWGNAPNAIRCHQINNLTAGLYCFRNSILSSLASKDNLVTGKNCCGSCIGTTTRTAPDKGSGWRSQYPGLY